MEVAFVGRSNVGKSSLINALVRRPLARTSASPGKTRLANFFRVQRGTAPALYLVDLPGYGYARGGDAAAREFNTLAEAYFSRATGYGLEASVLEGVNAHRFHSTPGNTSGPKGEGRSPKTSARANADAKDIGVLLLVDSRHPGLESDLEAWDWLRTQPVARGIVATKADKLTRAERVRHTRELESSFEAPVLLVSAQNGEGLEELWKLIARLPKETAA